MHPETALKLMASTIERVRQNLQQGIRGIRTSVPLKSGEVDFKDWRSTLERIENSENFLETVQFIIDKRNPPDTFWFEIILCATELPRAFLSLDTRTRGEKLDALTRLSGALKDVIMLLEQDLGSDELLPIELRNRHETPARLHPPDKLLGRGLLHDIELQSFYLEQGGKTIQQGISIYSGLKVLRCFSEITVKKMEDIEEDSMSYFKGYPQIRFGVQELNKIFQDHANVGFTKADQDRIIVAVLNPTFNRHNTTKEQVHETQRQLARMAKRIATPTEASKRKTKPEQ